MLSLNHLLWHPFENMFDGLAGSKIIKIEQELSLECFEKLWKILPVQQVSYGPLIMSIMLIMSCYTCMKYIVKHYSDRILFARLCITDIFT
jgi:hypothetical protein